MFDLFHSKPELIFCSEQPLNTEPPLARMRAACITPQQDFHIHVHGTIPQSQFDAAKHQLRIGGPGRNAARLAHGKPTRTLSTPNRDGGGALRRQLVGGYAAGASCFRRTLGA